MATAQPKIGLFAGIFDDRGRLLVKRRQPGETLAGDWDLPGGAVDADNTSDERIVYQEMAREVREETGLVIDVSLADQAMYPVIIKGGGEWAFLVYVGKIDQKPTVGKFRYVSLEGLNKLAQGPEGNRLVSGWGKRMHRLCLTAFCLLSQHRYWRPMEAPPEDPGCRAGKLLDGIYQGWESPA